MRTSSRLAFPAVLGALLVSGASLFANSTSAPLRVSVTVVRSCAVHATSLNRGAAQLDLNCAPGAASGVRKLGSLDRGVRDSASRLRLQRPTSPSPRAAGDRSFEVVAVDF
jgi:hypothetical protein